MIAPETKLPALTIDDVATWRLKEHAHLNGGAAFFGYIMRCIEQPRLTRFDRYDRKKKTSTSQWRVDGADVAGLEAAVAALNVPAVFTEAELAELQKVTEEWADIRRTRDLDLNHWLGEKGAIEWQNGKCRLTTIGIEAKRATVSQPSTESVK